MPLEFPRAPRLQGAAIVVTSLFVKHADGPIVLDTGFALGHAKAEATFDPVVRPFDDAFAEMGVKPAEVRADLRATRRARCGEHDARLLASGQDDRVPWREARGAGSTAPAVCAVGRACKSSTRGVSCSRTTWRPGSADLAIREENHAHREARDAMARAMASSSSLGRCEPIMVRFPFTVSMRTPSLPPVLNAQPFGDSRTPQPP